MTQLCHQLSDKARCKHYIVFCTIGHIDPSIEYIEQTASEIKIMQLTCQKGNNVCFNVTVKCSQITLSILGFFKM